MNIHVQRLMDQYPKEFEAFLKNGKDLPFDIYDQLYGIFFHEMPYGVAKARTGDPYTWLHERLLEEFSLPIAS